VAVVYRLWALDFANNCYQTSAPWSIKEAIERIHAEPIDEGVETDDKYSAAT